MELIKRKFYRRTPGQFREEFIFGFSNTSTKAFPKTSLITIQLPARASPSAVFVPNNIQDHPNYNSFILSSVKVSHGMKAICTVTVSSLFKILPFP